MTPSELHRKLIYCGYVDLNNYLVNSPTNRYIYNLMIDILPKHQIEVPIVTLFNEVYYQCTRVQFDGNPGDNVKNRYLEEEVSWLGSPKAALLVFCLMWALVKRKKQSLFNDDCFLKQITPLIENSEFMPYATELFNYMESECLVSPYQFDPMPCPVTEIPMRIDREYHASNKLWGKVKAFLGASDQNSDTGYNPWRLVTDNFSENTIRWYVSLYTDNEDQLQLLERIEKACNKQEHLKHGQFFVGLRMQIGHGNYDSANMRHYQTYGYSMYISDIMDRDELVVKEEAAKREEMKKSHELELERVKAKYEAEIAELKQQFAMLTGNEMEAEGGDSDGKTESEEQTLKIPEMVEHVKQRFSKAAAEEFSIMYYQLARKKDNKLDEETSKLIDGIVPAILQRDAHHQTINIPTAQQVNINPKEVVNHTKEE